MAGVLGITLTSFGLASCGGGTSATEGGTLTIAPDSFTDYEDPQLGYEASGWEAGIIAGWTRAETSPSSSSAIAKSFTTYPSRDASEMS